VFTLHLATSCGISNSLKTNVLLNGEPLVPLSCHMADFTVLAREYVLTDKDGRMHELALSAATGNVLGLELGWMGTDERRTSIFHEQDTSHCFLGAVYCSLDAKWEWS
jgi:hypothetical protein